MATIDRPRNRTWDPARTGLGVLLALIAVGLILFLIGADQGGPVWPFGVFLVLAVAAVMTYLYLTYRNHRSLNEELFDLRAARRTLEGDLLSVLDELRAGDMVSCTKKAQKLPKSIQDSFLSAADAITSLAQQIQNSSIEVAAAANSVNQIASELASGSSEQAASVVEITAAMEELARTAAQIADNASTQAELTAKAEETGNVGSQAVDEAVEGVEEVKKRISGIATRADSLGTRSKEIYRVLDLITDIAQETHILSLNAAIEAAAAGDHGRRFSVVAEEVRRLAQRSQESVDSVRNLLDEFTGSIRATVVATEEGSKEAARVLERARAAASAIDELRGASSDTARVAREISLATQQQNAASDQVVLTLKEVSQVVQRMADSLKQFSATADQLNDLGLGIQLVAQSFHLDSAHSLKREANRWAEEIRRRFGSWEAIESLLDELLADNRYLELAYVMDPSGSQLAISINEVVAGTSEIPTPIRTGEGLTDRPWFRGVMREGRMVITPVYESLLSGESCFTVAAPVRGPEGKTVGVLGLDVNVDSWTKI
jgi:methyl-accepting chemotaxis protein